MQFIKMETGIGNIGNIGNLPVNLLKCKHLSSLLGIELNSIILSALRRSFPTILSTEEKERNERINNLK
jgi:hypothetical protein